METIMAIADDVLAALSAGAKAGATAAEGAGQDLVQDVDKFLIPHLEDIAIQVASIVVKRQQGVFTDATAKALIDSQEDAIETLVETMLSLAVLEAQKIVNAIVAALTQAVNTALGFALLA
jgi:hypothetical protein